MAKREIREYNVFQCLACEKAPELNKTEMLDHLKKVHKINTKKDKGIREMIMHVDGSDYFIWRWKWTINGVEFTQDTCNKR